MSSATAGLMQEHQLILKYADLMERCTKLNLQKPDLQTLFDQTGFFIDFIHEFADRFHHAKEENILFRYLGTHGVLTHCNPVPQMMNEHEQARGFVRNMEKALRSKNLHDLAESTQHYAGLLKMHIYKEDNILYPMAEQGLSDELKASISREYAKIEAELDSPAIWEKYEALWIKLENDLTEYH
jgi:hemerythrin-like domain-containing protein